MRDVDAIVVREEATVETAFRILNETGYRILLVVGEEGRLRRTVTDGDLRRLLVSGGTMESSLRELRPREPKVAPPGQDPYEALAVMRRHGIDSLPVLDDAGRPVGLLLRQDLDDRILLSTPHLGEHELEFVEEAFRTNWIAPLGPNVDAFEREVADYVGITAGAATSSGTAALHLALRLAGVEPGDRVLCSSFSFIATANPIAYQGAEPAFVDSDPESWNMSPVALERALEDSILKGCPPRAVVVANIYGQSAEYDSIAELCRNYEVALVEDAAESLGATYKGRPSGSFGDVGIFSFNGNKIITTSGGGMLVSDDTGLVDRARFLATQAREPGSPYYEHSVIGYNYRMSNVLAGIGRGQLRVLDRRVEARRRVFDRYRECLADIAGLDWMPEIEGGRSTRWLSVCTLDEGRCGYSAGRFVQEMSDRNIETRHVWKPLHRQPVFAGSDFYTAGGSSVADDLFDRAVCLPSGSNLSEEQQDKIIRMIREILSSR